MPRFIQSGEVKAETTRVMGKLFCNSAVPVLPNSSSALGVSARALHFLGRQFNLFLGGWGDDSVDKSLITEQLAIFFF